MWSYGGYTGTGNVDHLVASLTGKTAVVAGNGEGVFEELREVLQRITDPIIFGVNDVGMYLPKLDHWVSLHIGSFLPWIAVREKAHLFPAKIHSGNYGDGVNYAWMGMEMIFILSGYFAMQIAYLMGADRIILCGVPGIPTRRFFDLEARVFGYGGGETRADKHVREQLREEMERLPEFKAKVRSCSGLTREFFGAWA